jgi:hypothetical protein
LLRAFAYRELLRNSLKEAYMKQVLIAILAGGLLGGAWLAPAQNTAPQNGGTEQQGTAPRIAPGSVIPVELTKGIDAKKAKTGDEVVAKVTQDMKTTNGEVLVPKDTKVVGRVTEAQPRSKEQKESEIGIAFDHAVMKNGSEMQLPMSIQAIIGREIIRTVLEPAKPFRAAAAPAAIPTPRGPVGWEDRHRLPRPRFRLRATTCQAIRRRERLRVLRLQRRPKAW